MSVRLILAKPHQHSGVIEIDSSATLTLLIPSVKMTGTYVYISSLPQRCHLLPCVHGKTVARYVITPMFTTKVKKNSKM